ncbi:hypothetical protein HPG69_007421 [Diceros bicornis minor]|uniref:Uncharacterized protein n=1 Tax=Diceros bicornis minor TaxID=77932 RepID=A0A7J7F866_DICBM|nr:hypothetical protein HPG69_007421 [Diceros bicornis minor]
MSNTQGEKTVIGIIELSHKYTGDNNVVDKPSLLKMLKENFFNFLDACDKNEDEKAEFFEFLLAGGHARSQSIVMDYHKQPQSGALFGGGSQ